MNDHPHRRVTDRRIDCNQAIRLYFCCSTTIASITSLLDPESLGWQLVQEVGPPAQWVMVLLGAMSLLGIIDSVLNDLLPQPIQLRMVLHYRDFGYMLMAAIYAAFVFMAVSRGHTSLLLIRYLVDMTACVYIAVCDVHYRYLMPRKRARQDAAAKGETWVPH